MTQPKSFASKVVDEYGGEYPQAIVVIRDWSISHQETGRSKDGVSPYEVSTKVSNLAYQLSYHYNESTRAQGKKLRPLYFEEGEGTSDVYTVDLDLPEVITILNGAGETIDKLLRAIEIDATMKFN
jgi:hypothetical protein